MTWDTFLDPDLSGPLCLTLLHSLWQVALLAAVVWGVERLLRPTVERRYVLYVTAMIGSLLALPITYALVEPGTAETAAPPRAPLGPTQGAMTTATAMEPANVEPAAGVSQAVEISDLGANPVDGQNNASTETGPETVATGQWWISLTPWVVAFYLAGVLAMLARLGAGIAWAQRLVSGSCVITDSALVKRFEALVLGCRVRVKPVLASAEQVVVPKVLGLLRPTILLPSSAMTGLSPGELEMILAHELAHLRRHDMWVNLLQRVAEAVLFFNPALWHLSRRISTLREFCCDEMTCRLAAQTEPEPRMRYATALLRIAEISSARSNRSALDAGELATLAASGRAPSEMRRRVARLLGEPLREPLHISRGAVLTSIAFAVSVAVGLPVWRVQADPPADRATAETIIDAVQDATPDETPFEFRLLVVGFDGTPVPHASVEIRSTPVPTADEIRRGEYVRPANYGPFTRTDDEGRLTFTLGRRPTRFNLSIEQPGYAPYWAGWSSSTHPEEIPLEFTAELDEAWSAGGVVVDESGRPVEGVEVHPSVQFKKRPGDAERLGVGTRIVTDSEGRWRFDNVPVSKSYVHVSINHPDFEPLRERLPRAEFEVALDATPVARIELKAGLSITGRVTDESGDPIAGALVRTRFINEIREARTNEEGEYRLTGCEPRMARIVVSATGRATDMQEVEVAPDMAPVSFSMKPGGRIRVRVVDEQGNGIPKARIFFQRWRTWTIGPFFEFDHVSQYADENGVWEWNEAPLDEFQADICRPGGMQLLYQPLVARDEEYVFRPPRALVISGTVIDAVTKEPVPEFRVVPGTRDEPRQRPGITWKSRDSYEATDGNYRIVRRDVVPAHLIRIEAEGYQDAVSREIMSDEGEVDLDFELQPVEDAAASSRTTSGETTDTAGMATTSNQDSGVPLRLYQLSDDQVLKWIPPEHTDERPEDPQPGSSGRIYEQDGDTVRLRTQNFGGDPFPLHAMVYHLLHVSPCELTGDASAWGADIVGDFVVRKDAAHEELLESLNQTLQNDLELNMKLNVSLRWVERESETWVVDGNFRPAPIGEAWRLPKENYRAYVLYGKSEPDNSSPHASGAGSFDDLLKAFGYRTGLPVVNELKETPSGSFGWETYHDRPDGTNWSDFPQSFANNVELVAEHFREQTGLQLHTERRTVDLLEASAGMPDQQD